MQTNPSASAFVCFCLFSLYFFAETACLELVQHLFNFWRCGTVKLHFWDCTIPQSQNW